MDGICRLAWAKSFVYFGRLTSRESIGDGRGRSTIKHSLTESDDNA
jgi:hypothetical protein